MISNNKPNPNHLSALWKIYQRTLAPRPTSTEIDRLWIQPSLTNRVLTEHLDNNDAAASRVEAEQYQQIDWFWQTLNLTSTSHILDVTCGPGLYATKFAQRGCQVTGVDFSPTVIEYANDLAVMEKVADHCTFIQQDIRQLDLPKGMFDAAILLYGQLESHSQAEAKKILSQIASTLKPGGKLCVELLNQNRVDQEESTWWYTDDQGFWGDKPYLHLGERFWYAEEGLAIERYHIVHLETGDVDELYICNQTYSIETMTALMQSAGFKQVEVYQAWGDLSLYDAEEWIVYVGTI